MGFSYCGGALCCDACGSTLGTRKVPCPVGWCPSVALYTTCRNKPENKLEQRRKDHEARGCNRCSTEARARQADADRRLAAGEYLRCSALSTGDGRVHVLFRGADGSTIGLFMDAACYRALPLVTNASPDDFARLGIGEISPAPADFYAKGLTA